MKILRHLYLQVLIAVILGCACGALLPKFGAALKPVNDGFISLVTMLISPIIFATIVVGMGSMRDLKKVGRVGVKALVYFEVVTTIALLIGMVVVNGLRPGAGIHANPASLDAAAVTAVTGANKLPTLTAYVLDIIPGTFAGALTSGKILQVLLVALLFGLALAHLGERARPLTELIELVLKALMEILRFIMKAAPLAAFSAMAYMVAKFGFGSLKSVLYLMGCVYLTMAIFIFVFLAAILRSSGLSMWRFLRYLREELFLVLGTSSSETALPGLMLKMENLGCAKSVVGLVVPAGYSFNLDGTSIYLTMAAIFVAQATDTPLGLLQQLGLLGILLLTSKGSAGVTGAGFITLSASLASSPVPVSGLTLILGIDRFMSQARSLTNLIGNGVAVVTVAAWENELDRARAKRVLAGEPPEIAAVPGIVSREA
jgi:aerobic C4-dicarboxylate transport protein